MKKEIKSFNKHRLNNPTNFREKIYVDRFLELTCVGNEMSIIGKDNQPILLSEDQDIAVQTVIQWLGTDAGQRYIYYVERMIEEYMEHNLSE